MSRSGWIAFGALVTGGLLGALLLWRALETEKPEKSLAPRGAKVLAKQTLTAAGNIPDQQLVRWRLGGQAEDPASGFYGVSIWQEDRELYAYRAKRGAVRLAVETGDFTGDGHDDVLLFVDETGGSGGCGTYRALATAAQRVRQVSVRFLCVDQGSIRIRNDGLLLRLGVKKNPRTAREAHCCYLFLRTTLQRWKGQRLVRVRSSVRRLAGPHPWPPGGYAPGGP